MHIKTITIQGFKSYRDQVAVDPFSPGHNVVVGRNGSGKSNFFAAIRFVLSDDYQNMNREERQRLLHEGTSTTTTLSAYVEIVFDNKDGRFPTSLDEVHLRRTIGLKKDEYSLDRKSVTKAEVLNLLESAGFSRSNPYYIVPQGRITRLTNMTDEERLNLLKEVAGTKVYEQKRAESTKIIEDTDRKREHIESLLATIQERLGELESEKEELKKYQKLDKDRRSLEYTINQRDLDEVTAALDQLEEDKNQEIHVTNERHKEFRDLEAKTQHLEEELTKAKHSLSTASISLQQYESELADLVQAKTEVECVIADFEAAGEAGETRRLELKEQFEVVEKKLAKGTKRLAEVKAELETRLAEERQAREALEGTQSQLEVLYAKQGRTRQFKSKAERDNYLNQEITNLKSYEKHLQKTIDSLRRDLDGAKAQLDEVAARSEAQNRGEDERRDALKEASESISKLRTDLDTMQEKRKELWREDGKLAQSVTNAKSELDNAERSLQSTMDRDTSHGLRAVRTIAKRLNLDGVYGALYELFEVSDRYKAAVETVAGTSLFHVVVDNDETADRLIESMNKEKSGRVTFMPLNRLRSVNVQYPQSDDAVPLISKLRFDPAYRMAFEQVFGRTIVCEDLKVAAQYSRSHGLNAVTNDGDRVDRKGALTGGYHDIKRSRLDAVRHAKKWRELYENDSKHFTEVKDGLTQLEQQITATMGEIQRLDAKRKSLLEDRSHQARQANWTQREEEQSRQRVSRLDTALIDAEGDLRGTTTKRRALEEEVKAPLQQQLSPAEVQQLETLSLTVETQKQGLLEATQARQKVSSEHNTLDIELSESLRRKREEIRRKLDDLDDASGTGILQAGEIDQRKAELRNLTRSLEQLSEQVKTTEEEVDELNAEISNRASQLDEVTNQQLEATRAIMKAQKNSDRSLAKKQTLLSRKEEFSNSIRDLGVLPEEAFTKFTSKSASELAHRLQKVQDGLRKYAHVNKKALEQYNNFTKQRDDHLQRQEELDRSADSINELIRTLDQRKDEAIERTFRQVANYFEEVFQQLVPAGRGELVIQKRAPGYIDDETAESGRGRDKSEIDNYTGISIQVSFNSKQDEGQRIKQLSGGQKSLVALATVFAIQKCDPAPFYLFDEIDANLDPQYRTAVAAMIHSLSQSAQFITTTFRPEMLVQADKFYGVYFDKQKVSTIQTITRDEAYQFIETAAELTTA
ncbi:Chromosome segregation protein sudA [Vanrija pseudolonga]|uniref:Structural maintenance of chromosomes protein n=1 Tax=Vanrija pseudolonga TaxID=143232 RepID=A0AAF0Y3L3_9TREE|nr:Chromosome segregation protein sudA [Vanrija pseudolonga]